MKPHDPDVEWIKKILADIERNRNDPQIAALMDTDTGVRTSAESAVEHVSMRLPIADLD